MLVNDTRDYVFDNVNIRKAPLLAMTVHMRIKKVEKERRKYKYCFLSYVTYTDAFRCIHTNNNSHIHTHTMIKSHYLLMKRRQTPRNTLVFVAILFIFLIKINYFINNNLIVLFNIFVVDVVIWFMLIYWCKCRVSQLTFCKLFAITTQPDP